MSKTFTLADVSFLTSVRGEALLQQLAHEDLSQANLLRLIPKLRANYNADETSAAIETANLRHKAVNKFGDDGQVMLFTRDALEQASHPLVRRYRASRAAGAAVVDVCCSIGSDALAFAASGSQVTGYDYDGVRLAMARYNAAQLGLAASFIECDVQSNTLPLSDADLLFYDPARRDVRGKRIHNVEQYQPPLSLLRRWQPDYATLLAKLSPGVDLTQLNDYAGTVTFISADGDLKEAELALGTDGPQTAAVLLTDDATHTITFDREFTPSPPIAEPTGWLHEPDPAIIRAGYVAHIAEQAGGAMLDRTIAYFTTPNRHDANQTYVRSWQILDWMPFNLKKLRATLKQRGVGTITVKKRGSPITPEELNARLKLKGSNRTTLVLTQYERVPVVLICADFDPQAQ